MNSEERIKELNTELAALQKRVDEINQEIRRLSKPTPIAGKTYSNYFLEIEETFNARRGLQRFLNPNDWALMEDWNKRGIPVEIITAMIHKVFDQVERMPRPKKIHSLAYFGPAIEEAFLKSKS